MKLTEYIEKKGIRKDWLAHRLGISRQMLHGICTGRRRPSKPLAKLIEFETNGEVKAAEVNPIQKRIRKYQEKKNTETEK